MTSRRELKRNILRVVGDLDHCVELRCVLYFGLQVWGVQYVENEVPAL
jgi:hypothetical protein